PLDANRTADRLAHQLQGDGTIETVIERFVDDSHASFAQPAENAVAADGLCLGHVAGHMIQNGVWMDVNLSLAGLPYDRAHPAGDGPRAFGYTRAAKAVLGLDRQITPLVEANTFKAIPGIGPTTDRIARELIHEGYSPFVERAVRDAGQEEAVGRLRALREH